MTSLRTDRRTVGGVGTKPFEGARDPLAPAPSDITRDGPEARRRDNPRWTVAAVAVAAAIAAGWAIGGSLVVMPHLSVNYDEPVYLLQADALAHGRLFPPAPEPTASFAPWFGVESDGAWVLKYTPVHAGILAVGRLLLGSERASLGALAAGAVVLVYLLGREVLGDPRRAVAASLLLLASPLFLIQSMTFLPYLSNVVLLLAFATAYLRGNRTGAALPLLAAGLALGLAFFSRPFDAVLFAMPLILWSVLRQPRATKALAARVGWLTLGALGPLVVMVWFNVRSTGHPLHLAFSLIDPLDKLGFGPRRMILSTDPLSYTPWVAVRTLARYAAVFTVWSAGGLLLVGLFIAGLRRATGPQRALAAVAVSIPFGYLFFWGPAHRPGITSYVGPFYYMPVVIPLSILAVRGLGRVARWSRPLTACLLAGMAVASGVVVGGAVRQNLSHTAVAERVHRPIIEANLDRAVVFVPAWHLLIPFAFTRNDTKFDGPIIWALDRGDGNLSVSDAFPDRALYALDVPDQLGAEGFRPQSPLGREGVGLQRLERVRAPQMEWALRVEHRTNLPVVSLEVSVGAAPASVFVLRTSGRAGEVDEGTLRVGPGSVAFLRRGSLPVTAVEGPPGRHGLLTATLTAAAADGSAVRVLGRLELPYRAVGSEIDLLAPAGQMPGFSEARARRP